MYEPLTDTYYDEWGEEITEEQYVKLYEEAK